MIYVVSNTWEKLKKKRILLSCLLVLLCAVTGCGITGDTEAEDSQDTNPAESIITLYHVEGNEVVADDEKYQLRQPDSISNSLDEIMAIQPMPEGILYNSFFIDENKNVSISVNVEQGISVENLLLNKAAIVYTVGQIEGIQSIELVISNLDGVVIESAVYTMDSFYFYENEE